jgi:hypothetical protein
MIYLGLCVLLNVHIFIWISSSRVYFNMVTFTVVFFISKAKQTAAKVEGSLDA